MGGHPHRAIRPVRCFAAREIEMPVAFFEQSMEAALCEFSVDRFERDAHAGHYLATRGETVNARWSYGVPSIRRDADLYGQFLPNPLWWSGESLKTTHDHSAQ